MPSLFRRPTDYFFGTLSTPASSSDNTLSSTAFTNLPSDYTTGLVLPMTLNNPALGVYEVVWVTAHSANSPTVTVIRGKEGTVGLAWPAGTQIISAPTAARDALGAITSTTRPTDAHIGHRTVETDTGRVLEFTANAGWQPSAGACFGSDAGPTDIDGNDVPDSATIIPRVGNVVGITVNNQGEITVPFRTPFPNDAISCFLTNAAEARFNGVANLVHLSASQATFHLWNVTGGSLVSSTGGTFSGCYLAYGW